MELKEYNVDEYVEWHRLAWSSDWNGYEVGYDDIDVVGLYRSSGHSYYINAENGQVLEKWADEDDEFGE